MLKRMLLVAMVVAAVTAMPEISTSQQRSYGILGHKAPAWQVDEWYNLGDDVERIDVSDFKGKIVYLFGFQSWCPGCHSHGFPTLQAVEEHYRDNDDVVSSPFRLFSKGITSTPPIRHSRPLLSSISTYRSGTTPARVPGPPS